MGDEWEMTFISHKSVIQPCASSKDLAYVHDFCRRELSKLAPCYRPKQHMFLEKT